MSVEVDRELVTRVQAGDPGAVGELFALCWRGARAAAYGVTSEWATAEDAASEAFSQAMAAIGTLQDTGRFRPWLRTIVVRAARRKVREAVPSDADAGQIPDSRPAMDKLLERQTLIAVVQQAMRRLPAALREAIALQYFEGYELRESARFLNIRDSTLRRRLHDGRLRLRGEVERLLKGRKEMTNDLHHLKKFKEMIAAKDLDRAMREILAIRPAPAHLLDLLRKQAAGSTEGSELARKAAAFLKINEERKGPLEHVIFAIRAALPAFQEWQVDLVASASQFFDTGDYRDRLQTMLPPGFAQGRPGRFLRLTRAIGKHDADGSMASAYELLQNGTLEREGIVTIPVFDLTWMVEGTLELRSVQQQVEELIGTFPTKPDVRFTTYYEPRYRASFQLHFGDASARVAVGGVLNEWPGHPRGMTAAHVRLFVESWAGVCP